MPGFLNNPNPSNAPNYGPPTPSNAPTPPAGSGFGSGIPNPSSGPSSGVSPPTPNPSNLPSGSFNTPPSQVGPITPSGLNPILSRRVFGQPNIAGQNGVPNVAGSQNLPPISPTVADSVREAASYANPYYTGSPVNVTAEPTKEMSPLMVAVLSGVILYVITG